MGWCRQATSHYLSQWGPRSLASYGINELNQRLAGRDCFRYWLEAIAWANVDPDDTAPPDHNELMQRMVGIMNIISLCVELFQSSWYLKQWMKYWWPRFTHDTGVMYCYLTHWGRVTHTCIDNPSINGSDNGLLSSRRKDIIWTNDRILLIGSLETNFSEILIEIHTFSFKKMYLKISSGNTGHFYPLVIIHMKHIDMLNFDDKSDRKWCFFLWKLGDYIQQR